MSEQQSPAGGDPHALEQLRQQAKLLLKLARAGDPVVIGRLRELLPRLAEQNDAQVAESIRLADVQHAVARKLGRESWAALKAEFESLDPIHAEAARFLKALRDDDTAGAMRVLERTPAVATYSVHTAAALGDADSVRGFLAADPTLANAPSPGDPVPPLIYAVYEDIKRERDVPPAQQLATVRALLEAGADANGTVPIPDVSDTIPALYFPCVHDNVAVARLLLEHGANPTDGESLYHAAQHGHEACLALLVEFGAELHRGPAAYGNTPLHFLAAHTPDNPIAPAALRGLRWLLAQGADPSITSTGPQLTPSQQGETPLHRAAAVGHDADVLLALVAHGAPVNARRTDGLTAYQLAARLGHHAGTEALAQAGAETSLSPTDRLLAACATLDEPGARALLSEQPGLLRALGPDERDALGLALTHGRFDVARLMIDLGWPLDQDGQWGGTPLHWAAWNGHVEMARRLVEAGAPVNHRDTRYGSSPLGWCCHGSRYCGRANDEDYPAIIHLLLDAGATRAESYNQWNESPESLARPSVVAALRARGVVV